MLNLKYCKINTKYTRERRFYVAGAFGGNEVHPDGSVMAMQYVNPQVLRTMSNAYGKPGQDMIHEITEAYQGAKISQRSGVGVRSSTVDDERDPNSVYRMAHDSAVPQSGDIIIKIYDRGGLEIKNPRSNIYRAEFIVYPRRSTPVIIMTYP